MTAGSKYNELLNRFNPRIIRSEKEYWEMQSVMDQLIDKPDLSDDELDYLSLLGMFIERYDEENDVFPEMRGVDLVRALLEDMGLRQKDLVPIFKSESIVSEVLNGNRKMMAEHIDGLSKMFQLPQSVFFESDTVVSEPIRYIDVPLDINKPDSNFDEILIPGFHNKDSMKDSMIWRVPDEMDAC